MKQTETKLPPEYADLTMTIEINQKKWAELEAQGYSSVDIQKRLEEALTSGISRIQEPLLLDVDEVKVRKFR